MIDYPEEKIIIRFIVANGKVSLDEIMRSDEFVEHRSDFIQALLMRMVIKGKLGEENKKYFLLKSSV